MFMMCFRSRIVLCIPLVLKVAALMDGCMYSRGSNDSCCVLGCYVVRGSFMVGWVCVPWVCV